MASSDGLIRCRAALHLAAHRPEAASQAIVCLGAEIVRPVEGTAHFSYVIHELSKTCPQMMHRLARSLGDGLPKATSAERRLYIIEALGEIGADAKAAVPAMLNAAESSESLVAIGAIASLAKIDPQSAVAMALKRSIESGAANSHPD
jgi:HEAT repeat protein